MTKLVLIILCVLCLGLVAGGCARGIPQDNGRARCLTWSPGSTLEEGAPFCLEREEVCMSYFPGQSLESADRAQCLAHCDAVKRAQQKLHPADGCDSLIRKGWDLCRSHCSSK